MAKVITEISGIPANDAERKAIGLLRDNLPDSWMLFHNFELRQGEEVFEIDLAVMSPHAVYLVDVKGTFGLGDTQQTFHHSGRLSDLNKAMRF